MEHEIPLVFARSKRLRVEYIKYVQSQVDKILSNHALRLDKFIRCILNQGNLIDQNFCDCDKKNPCFSPYVLASLSFLSPQ